MVGQERMVPALEQALRKAPEGMLAVHGMRGTGKTTLAQALCAWMQRSFPGRTCLIEFPTLDKKLSDTEAAQLLWTKVQQLGVQPLGSSTLPNVSTCLLYRPCDAAATHSQVLTSTRLVISCQRTCGPRLWSCIP